MAAHDRPGRQWDQVGRLTGSPLLDPLLGPGVVVVVDELGRTCSKCRRPKISLWSRHRRRAGPTNPVGDGVSLEGDRNGNRMTSAPSLLKTSSKAAANLESRSRSRNLALRTPSWRFHCEHEPGRLI